jgi:hypothetical protein
MVPSLEAKPVPLAAASVSRGRSAGKALRLAIYGVQALIDSMAGSVRGGSKTAR